MNYMLIIIEYESHPFCLKIVVFRMGNLQVTHNSCSCEWTSLTCVLGALIRNGMRNFVVAFYSLRIIYEIL